MFAHNRELPIQLGQSGEIPLRKIELVAAGGQSLDETRRTAEVRAVLHPADATWRDVSWSVVDAAGIPSNLAIVEAAGQTALVTARGAGAFLLRCTSRNGGSGTRLLSQLEWTVTGLGTAYKDPYGFVSAGLYTRSRGEVSNGNERGVATARGAETRVCVEGIDFGPFGSDTIMMPIFALTSEPYAMQIWEGMPGDDGSQMLADVVYQKPSRWNVYQEETFRLSRRLRGSHLSALYYTTRYISRDSPLPGRTARFRTIRPRRRIISMETHLRSRTEKSRRSATTSRWSSAGWHSGRKARLAS